MDLYSMMLALVILPALAHTRPLLDMLEDYTKSDHRTDHSSSSLDHHEEAPSRTKRGAREGLGPDSLLNGGIKTPALDGDVIFSARRFTRVYFGFDYRVLSTMSGYKATVQMYKMPLKTKKTKNTKRRQSSLARVSLYQVLYPTINQHSSIRLLDSKLVDVQSKGWMDFDVTTAVKDWSEHPKNNFGLEVWIESSKPGKTAVRNARKTRFVKPNAKPISKRPELVVSFPRGDKKKRENEI